MEKQELIELVLLHAPSTNPVVAHQLLATVPLAELQQLLQGRLDPAWPHQSWLRQILPLLDSIIAIVKRPEVVSSLMPTDLLELHWSLADPPPKKLWLRGKLPAAPFLVVVGPRRPSNYATSQTERLVRLIAPQRTVVSGLAFGIDMTALRTAIKAGGQVVAVVPFGVSNIYPSSHRTELESWVKAGRAAIISEYWSINFCSKLHFWWRNRLMAAMADRLFIPEAAERSGTSKTAEYALALNKELAVLPADITRSKARYSNRLMAEGAIPITNTEDWFQFCKLELISFTPADKYAPLLAVLSRGCFEPECILANLNIAPAEFNRLLTEAELAGLILRTANGMYQPLSP